MYHCTNTLCTLQNRQKIEVKKGCDKDEINTVLKFYLLTIQTVFSYCSLMDCLAHSLGYKNASLETTGLAHLHTQKCVSTGHLALHHFKIR